MAKALLMQKANFQNMTIYLFNMKSKLFASGEMKAYGELKDIYDILCCLRIKFGSNKELSDYLKIKPHNLQNWRNRGKIPPKYFNKISSSIGVDCLDILLKSHIFSNKDEKK